MITFVDNFVVNETCQQCPALPVYLFLTSIFLIMASRGSVSSFHSLDYLFFVYVHFFSFIPLCSRRLSPNMRRSRERARVQLISMICIRSKSFNIESSSVVGDFDAVSADGKRVVVGGGQGVVKGKPHGNSLPFLGMF